MASEKIFENKIKDFLKSKGVYYFKMLGCGATRAGVPDLICCINGRFVAIEVKAEGKKASVLQMANIRHINECKGVGIVVMPSEFTKLKCLIEDLLNVECDQMGWY